MTDWQEQNNWLTKTFEFGNFVQAAGFIAKIVPLAENQGHHPDISLHDYKKVTIKLHTHSADNTVTDKDWKLARAIDQL